MQDTRRFQKWCLFIAHELHNACALHIYILRAYARTYCIFCNAWNIFVSCAIRWVFANVIIILFIENNVKHGKNCGALFTAVARYRIKYSIKQYNKMRVSYPFPICIVYWHILYCFLHERPHSNNELTFVISVKYVTPIYLWPIKYILQFQTFLKHWK